MMLNYLGLKNFKCFVDAKLRLSPLTVLCGMNGSGKSTIIQSLLILRQSFLAGELLEGRLVLGGEGADLGTGVDVLYEYADQDVISFELASDTIARPWVLRFEYDRAADLLSAGAKRTHRPPSYVAMEWREHPPFGGHVQYVNAERIGPRKWHLSSETMARRQEIGSRGEYVINFLNEHSTDQFASDDRRVRSDDRRRILDVVEDWLREMTPGAHLEMEAVAAADAVIAGFSFDRSGDVASRRYRATNVGFGLSYVLPVLVALLSPAGSLAMVENPEAHLHPRAQTKLGELAALAANSGVQVLVETHSDHFLDGIRVAAREGVIPPERVAIHYVAREGGRSVVTSPVLDRTGRLSFWPEGFFDQRDENLARLLAPRGPNA
jgi:predicted ATPase